MDSMSLEEMELQENVDKAIKLLKSKNVKKRRTAILELYNYGTLYDLTVSISERDISQATIPIAKAVVFDKDKRVREIARKTIKKADTISRSLIIDLLKKILNHKDPKIRRRSIYLFKLIIQKPGTNLDNIALNKDSTNQIRKLVLAEIKRLCTTKDGKLHKRSLKEYKWLIKKINECLKSQEH